MADLKELESNIGYKFRNVSLLKNALIHPSYINEKHEDRIYSNQRLEFFGDSVLSLAVSEYIFTNLKSYPEGKLTKLRSDVVREESLAQMARGLELGKFLFLGKGEMKSGGDNRDSTLCDAMEAVIAAVYLDGGYEAAKKLILDNLTEKISLLISGEELDFNFKTDLQELVQSDGGNVTYKVIAENGPEHAKEFETAVFINGKEVSHGKGSSKKRAEQSAARKAIEIIKK